MRHLSHIDSCTLSHNCFIAAASLLVLEGSDPVAGYGSGAEGRGGKPALLLLRAGAPGCG